MAQCLSCGASATTTQLLCQACPEMIWLDEQPEYPAPFSNSAVDQADQWRRVGVELLLRGQPADAETYFERSLDANPLDYRTYLGFANLLFAQGRTAEARARIEQGRPHLVAADDFAAYDPTSFSLRLLGRLHAVDGDHPAARQCLQQAVDGSPQYLAARYELAVYCSAAGDAVAALENLRAAIAGSPKYWRLADREPLFDNHRAEVNDLRNTLLEEVKTPFKKIGEYSGEVDALVQQVKRTREFAQAQCRECVDLANRIHEQLLNGQDRLAYYSGLLESSNYQEICEAQESVNVQIPGWLRENKRQVETLKERIEQDIARRRRVKELVLMGLLIIVSVVGAVIAGVMAER